MTELRILTVRQPWAWAIIHGGKDVENRVRNIAGDYRGPTAIHAARSYGPLSGDQTTLARAMREHWYERFDQEHRFVEPWHSVRGAIVGVVDLVDVHHDDRDRDRGFQCSEWAEIDAYHLVLANPRPLSEPIPFKGALGLRRLDEATEAAVWSQIGGTDV